MGGHGRPSDSWWGATTPTTGPTGTTPIWQILHVEVDQDGWIDGIRARVDSSEDGNYWGLIWNPATLVTLRAFCWRQAVAHGSPIWHQTWLHPRLRVLSTDVLRLAVMYPAGKRFQTTGGLATSPTTHNHIQFFSSATSTALYVQLANPTFGTAAPGIDILYTPDT